MTSVNVTAVTNTVTVTEGDTTVVTVTTAGPQGPGGGGGAAAYVHTQASPATTWTINHNLGFRPSVELLDSGSQEIDGDIAHPTINQTVVTLNPATAGLARLI
jgi:hypothetical protein